MTKVEEYELSDRRLARAQDKFAKLAKRAAKLGVPAPMLHVQSERVIALKWNMEGEYWATVPEELAERHERVTTVTVSGVSPKLPGGWKLAATIQHTEVGNAVRVVPDVEFDATPYREGIPACDHCKTVRRRRDTYIVVNDEGAVRQVGSNCIADFLGGVDPEYIVAFASSVIDALSDMEGEPSWGMRDRNTVYVPEFLAEVIASIEANGWLSKGKAQYGETPTAGRALDNMFALCNVFPPCYKHNTSHRDCPRPTEEQVAEADVTLTWLRDRFGEDGISRTLDDYEWNLSVAVRRDWVESREAGITASAVYYYRRELEKELKLAERAARKADAGPAPRGREQVSGRVVNLKWFASDYAEEGVEKMTVVLENGATVWCSVPKALSSVSQGDRIQFTATFEAGSKTPTDDTFAVGKRPSKATKLEEEA